MRSFLGLAAAVLAVAALVVAPAQAQNRPAQSSSGRAVSPQQSNQQKPRPEFVHRVIVQVTQNDAETMNVALNNIDNMTKHFAGKGEKVEVEIVAYAAGLHMFREDTSPVKSRLSALAARKDVTLSGCGSTIANQSKQEERAITLVPEARTVPSGIARVVELQEQGWTYVRP
jgi:intracellular sulfur oxidation DsrE/DsrF family protein